MATLQELLIQEIRMLIIIYMKDKYQLNIRGMDSEEVFIKIMSGILAIIIET
jgi:hypothetical protein